MFRKLRRKLTIINALIMLTLFGLLTAGAYLFFQMDFNKHNQMISKRILFDLQNGLLPDLPGQGSPPHTHNKAGQHIPQDEFPPPKPDSFFDPKTVPLFPLPPPPPVNSSFFVRISADGMLLSQSSNQLLDQHSLVVLARQALEATATHDNISLQGINYSYFKEPVLTEPENTIILFRDLSQDKNLMQILLTALLAVGLLCSLLSFIASFFLANKAMLPIQTVWQQQRDFLSDASHELRTPLAVIQTNLELVRDCPDETISSQDKWLKNIQEEVICMTNLVDSLLFLARADSNAQQLDLRLSALPANLQKAAEPFLALAAAKNITLEIITKLPGKNIYYADIPKLKQVLAILLDNAIRHTPVDGIISLVLVEKETKAIITLTDSGEGIAPEYLHKIFDRFFQVDEARSKGGAGLGLAIAKCIIETHGGQISVSSIPKQGTTFTIYLPATKNNLVQKLS